MQQGPPGRGGVGQAERSARSVFVGNISYDASEAQLRQLFSQVGPVLSFRLMVDHDTGRPKGYGFCEFAEPATVDKAIRALNGHELHGRSLRVDSASGGSGDRDHRGGGGGERDKDERDRDALQVGVPGSGTNGNTANDHSQPTPPAHESPYGPEPETGKAPEAIAKTVASMPPERMYELMRQMKETVNNNPQMARHLLMENPQLAYALLQAQVIMRVVDPKVAYQMLHREQPASLAPFHHMPEAGGQPPPAPAAAGPMSMPPPSVMGAPMVMPSLPPGQAPPFPFFMNPHPQMGAMMPGFQGPNYHFPGFPMPPPANPPVASVSSSQRQDSTSTGGMSEDDEQQQAAMLVKVLQLTDEQIRLLPPEDRAKVIELRNQLRAQVPT